MICYIAYPTSLSLQSANALQTYATLRALRAARPDTMAIIARWGKDTSQFADLDAIHLPRPALGKLSRLYPSSLWYYMEYSAFAWMCVPFVRAHPVRVIYVRQNICAAWWSSVFGPRFGIPVIYEAHDLESRNPSRAKEPWAQGIVHLIDRIALTRASRVVSLTGAFRDYVVGLGWRRPSDIAIIPDAYDEQLFRPHSRVLCRTELNLPPNAPIIAYAGMTFAHRWLDGLCEAVAQLVSDYPTLLLLIVGGRPAEQDALRRHAHRLGIAAHVHVMGAYPQDEVVHILSAADVLVIPDTLTDTTASPLKLFEYLAMGQPIVLPDMPALHEILSPIYGHYFPRRHLEGLVRALRAALHQKDNERARLARQMIARDHTYTRRADRIIDLIRCVEQLESVKPRSS